MNNIPANITGNLETDTLLDIICQSGGMCFFTEENDINRLAVCGVRGIPSEPMSIAHATEFMRNAIYEEAPEPKWTWVDWALVVIGLLSAAIAIAAIYNVRDLVVSLS